LSLQPITDADKTPERFEQMLQAMYRKYVGAEARDIQFEYFRTLQKPMKSSMLDHSSRMLTLARYGNKLPGTEPPLTTDEQIKKCIQSFSFLQKEESDHAILLSKINPNYSKVKSIGTSPVRTSCSNLDQASKKT
jgi:hypothetical protein